MSEKSPLFNNSLRKGLDILMAFGSQNPDMNLPEIAKATGLSKSAAQRYAYTLESMGFLSKNERTKRYALTPKTVELGYRYLLVNPLIEKANPFLKELNRITGETINLSVPNLGDMIYVARFTTTKSVTLNMPVGQNLPMFCTASGRAYLSHLPINKIKENLSLKALIKYTPNTITDPDELIDMIVDANRVGYAYACGEYYRGDLNLAVAITNAHKKPIASVNISAPSSRWTLDNMRKELVPYLLSISKQLSEPVTPLRL